MRIFFLWFRDRFDLSTNWLVYLLMLVYFAGTIASWLYPKLLKEDAVKFATLAFLLALACYASYTVKINKLLRQADNIEKAVSLTADKFFVQFKELNSQLGEQMGAALEVTICATFPYEFLRLHKGQLKGVLKRKGRVVFILPKPGCAAACMSKERASDYENEFRLTRGRETKTWLGELQDFSKREGGVFLLKATEYWPSCIVTFVRHEVGKACEGRSIFITINNYGQADQLRPSFVAEEGKAPKTYNVFRDDLRNIEERAQVATAETIII